MHVLTHPPQTARTQAILGCDHSLTTVQQRITVRLEQSAVFATALVASVAALIAGATEALAAVLACAVAEAALAVRLATLTSDRRACILDLIIEGRGGVPLPAVQRECRRLRAPAHRHELARSLRELADEAQRHVAGPLSCRPFSSCPLYRPCLLAALAPDLHATADRLDGEPVGLAGIALTERLLTAHDSPLYGPDAAHLRQELRRIGFVLELRGEPSRPTI